MNRLQALRLIRQYGPISRAELALRVGISAPSISEVVADLEHRGLVTEFTEDRPVRSRGRPRRLLEICSDTALVLAVSLTWHGVLELNFVNLAGALVFGTSVPVGGLATLDELVAAVGNSIELVLGTSPVAGPRVMHVAISVPGSIDSRNGILHWLPTLPAPPFDFSSILERRLKLPVTIEGDVEAIARARYWFSKTPIPPSFMLVYVGMLVGTAYYHDNAPRLGANGLSEFAHVKIDSRATAKKCFCTGRGCLATTCSIPGLVDRSSDWTQRNVPDLDKLGARFDELIVSHYAGDRSATRLFILAGQHLGLAVANQINSVDPGHVVIQTSHPGFADLLEPPFRRVLVASVLPVLAKTTKVVFEATVEDWRWKGAAALALEQVYSAD